MRWVVASWLSLLAGSLAAKPVDGEAGWQLRTIDEAQDIEVYLRLRADHHREFFGVTRVPARMASVIAVLQDSKAMPQWAYRVREVQVLEATEPHRGVLRVLSDLPWPLTDREAVLEWQLRKDEGSCDVTLNAVAANHRAAPTPGLVRMPEMESKWRLKPLPGGVTEVSFAGYGHMGGNLNHGPLRAFMSTSVWQAPLETLRGLRTMVQQAPYNQAQVPGLCDRP